MPPTIMPGGRASRTLLLGILENLSLYNIVVLAITVSIVIVLGVYIGRFLRKLTKKKIDLTIKGVPDIAAPFLLLFEPVCH